MQGNVLVAVGPLCICTRVVKDVSSTVTILSTTQGSISENGGSHDEGAWTARTAGG